MGVKFIFITLAAQHAMGYGASRLLEDLKARKQDGYIDLQRKEWASNGEVPTRSHHLFTGVPYHHLMGEELGSARFGHAVDGGLEEAKVL
jgi:isocitrate lyase